MKTKKALRYLRHLRYLAYMAVIILLMYLETYMVKPLVLEAQRSWRISPSIYLIPLIFNLAIGSVLGFDHTLGEIKKVGKWTVNLPKVIIMVLPSLYFSLAIALTVVNNKIVQKIIYPACYLLSRTSSSFIIIFQLILGYTLITSLFRKTKSEFILSENECGQSDAEVSQSENEYSQSEKECIQNDNGYIQSKNGYIQNDNDNVQSKNEYEQYKKAYEEYKNTNKRDGDEVLQDKNEVNNEKNNNRS